jgi:hypothetical protein
MNKLSSYCGLDDAKIRASDKDLPVPTVFYDVTLKLLASWMEVFRQKETFLKLKTIKRKCIVT